MRLLLSLLILLLFPFLLSAAARAESRLAFVVGVDAYAQLPPASQLQRAVADAEAVGEALEGLGFEVTHATRAGSATSLGGLLKSFAEFKARVRNGDTVFLFFAGHGLGLSDGSYLLPSDVTPAALEADYAARRAAIREAEWTDDLQRSGARVVIVVIDACRNEIFARGLTRSAAFERGLAPTPTEGVFKLYSASEGQSAMDRLPGADPSKNSVFTRVFLKALKDPKLDLNRLGAQVRDEVFDVAKGAYHEQTPAVYDRLVGSSRIFLAARGAEEAGSVVNLKPSTPPSGGEAEEFAAATAAASVEALDAFLTKYPNGSLAGIARQERTKLKEASLSPSNSLSGPGATASNSPEIKLPEVSEAAAWEEVKRKNSRESIRAFIKYFPSSSHRSEADALLANLETPSTIDFPQKPAANPQKSRPSTEKREKRQRHAQKETQERGPKGKISNKCFMFNGHRYCE